MFEDPAAQLAFRRELTRQFGTAPVALSTDGRHVEFTASVDAGLGVGRFAVVEDEGAPPLVLQIHAARLAEREGPTLQTDDLAASSLPGTTATFRPLLRFVTGFGVVVGTLDDERFSAASGVAPFGERLIRSADETEVGRIMAGLIGVQPSLEVGVLRQAPSVSARLLSKGFARHTFMCGQSGSGKTYTTGGLFERLLAGTTLPIVVLDPNSDHVHLGRLRDESDDSPEARRFAAAAADVRVARARGLDASFTLCADFSDLPLDVQALLLRLHPVRDADEFDALRRITAQLVAPYSAHDVVDAADRSAVHDPLSGRIARRMANLAIADWTIWRRADETSIAQYRLSEARCLVLDLGSLPTPDERTAVALTVLGNRWRNRADRSPVLIAIDEAHNVLPAHTDDPLLQATTELGILIAGEGRKFGLHLFVATQRPSKVHPNIVSQCDNLILMRMNGARDVDDLVSLFSHVPEAMIRASLGFGLGQALFAGPITPVPAVVQVGTRRSPEGGADVPTTWATPRED